MLIEARWMEHDDSKCFDSGINNVTEAIDSRESRSLRTNISSYLASF